MTSIRRITEDQLIYLTSAVCEDTGHASAQFLDAMGLPYGSFNGEFYPLTEREIALTADDAANLGGFSALMGYTVLLEGKKYLAPTFELTYGYDTPKSVDKASARSANNNLLEIVRTLATQTDGRYLWDKEPEFESGYVAPRGKYVATVLIPFEYAAANASDYNEWVSHLDGKIRSYR